MARRGAGVKRAGPRLVELSGARRGLGRLLTGRLGTLPLSCGALARVDSVVVATVVRALIASRGTVPPFAVGRPCGGSHYFTATLGTLDHAHDAAGGCHHLRRRP